MTTQFNPTTYRASARIAPVLFTLTIFTSASLLFFVQPLFTRIVLPNIGGASAVWTTAMLFFQSVLIAGYLYAHVVTRYLPVAAQIGLHLALWAAALWFLPLAISETIAADWAESPALQTLILYALGVGVPFAVLSANAPLIQSWYVRSGGPSADDPYFLYGASNLGSLISLLAFPLVAEPMLGVSAIGQGWAFGFVALGALLLTCGLVALRGGMSARTITSEGMAPSSNAPTLRDYAMWALLAFIPSSLMLGVTSKISTDLGSFPLIWVIPLALYLLTFVTTFTNRPILGGRLLLQMFRLSMVILVVIATDMFTRSTTWIGIVLLLASFFVVTTMAHATLFIRRPSKEHLTLFYVTMSVGGALGGIFNSIVAPIVFNDIHELRIVVAVAAVLLVTQAAKTTARDIASGMAIGFIALLPVSLLPVLAIDVPVLVRGLAVGAILLGGYYYLAQRGQAAVAATAVAIAAGTYLASEDSVLRDRSFFGAHLVRDTTSLRQYMHGTTIHGAQRLAEFGTRPTPIVYYSLGGPMGQILTSPRGKAAKTVGIVGLGVGALSCYRQPHQDWEFYEIDKVVDEIARNPKFFTFMSSCAGDAPTHLGDARIVLDQQTGKKFDILVIDAYSSDAVPVHLTTIEAMQLYRDRLAPGGLLIFHISNRYFKIELPLGRSAAELGMAARMQFYVVPKDKPALDDFASQVVVMAEDEAALQDIATDPRWTVLRTDGGTLWTDDYANPLSILR